MNIPDIPQGTSKAEAALIYARAGIPVFPCDSNKDPIGRLAPNGFYSQTTDEAVITKWWDEYPDANPASAFDAHTLILDVDDTAKAKSVTDLLPKTGPVQTSGRATRDNPKHHRVYEVNGQPIRLTRIPELGIETKGLLKGYILLAPSTTEGTYQWVRTGQPEPLPASLYATLTAKRPKTASAEKSADGQPVITVTGGPCANWCDRTGPIARDPGGYQYLNDYAFHRVTYHRDTLDWQLEDALLPLIGRMDPPYIGSEAIDNIKKVVGQMVADIASGKVEPDATGETNAEPVDEEEVMAEMRSLRIVVSDAVPNPNRDSEYLVHDLIRPGALVVLASQEGVGKSYIGSEIALRGAIGSGALFDHLPYAITRQFRTTLLDEENGSDEEADREEMALATIGASRADLGERYTRYSFSGADLISGEGKARVNAAVSLDQPDMLILDTATQMVGEEWGPELKAAIRWLRRLADDNALAVLLLVHLVKPQRDRNGARQTNMRNLSDVMGQWPRPVDAVIVISGASGEDRIHFDVYKRVPNARLVLAQRSGIWVVVGTGTSQPAMDLSGVPGGRTGKAILQAIADSVDGLNYKVLGVSESGFHNALKALRGEGLVEPGQPYRLTPSGVALLHPDSTSALPDEEDSTLD